MNTRHHILLVDDDTDLLSANKALLEESGFAVDTASGGAEAIARLGADEFDLILLDMNMPQVNGQQVLEFINDQNLRMAIVVISTEIDFDTVTNAFHLGAFDYLRKPCEFNELRNTLNNALRKLELEKSLYALRKQLERSERLHRFMIESSPDIIFIVDKNGNIAFANDRAEELLNYKKNELIGAHYATIVDPEYVEKASHCFNERRAGPRATRDAEIWLKCKPGSQSDYGRGRIAIELNSLGVYENESRDEAGGVNKGEYSGTYVVARDITERLASEKLIHYQAYHDLLTGLPNRALFQDRLTNTISNARRESDKLAVLFLDLDRFKVVNDTLGHSVGDELLKQMGSRLRASLREGDTVARLGGDEFIVLLPHVDSDEVVTVVSRKLLETVKAPFIVDGNEIFITVSIGMAIYPVDGATAEELIKNSDIAMYYTKDKGKNSFNRFSEDMSVTHARMLNMETDIRRGMTSNQFEVFYQPQVRSDNGDITGVEALLRWNHPEKGLITPSAFMKVAEETGIIVELGDWVLDTAVAEVKAWLNDDIQIDKLAINFSSRQIEQPDFVDKIVRTLEKYDFPGDKLELEITESMLMHNIEQTVSKLHELHSIGVHVAIDDFGTGYSSLSLLHKLPIHRLKIDRSFINDMTESTEHSIIEAIAYMARGLKLEMVAEGVEQEFQLTYLRSLACPVIQGFIYSRAVPAPEVLQLIRDARAAAARDLERKGKGKNKGKRRFKISAN